MTTERSPRVVPIDGQIDLVELAQGILRQKWLIASFFLLATALAVVYAFYSRPIYEARASVLPPSLNEISGFNLGRKESDLGVFSVKDIYDVFIRNLMAEETRQNFFKEKYLPTLGDKGAESLDALYNKFNDELQIKASVDGSGRYLISAVAHESDTAAYLVDSYIEMVAGISKNEMLKNIKRDLHVKSVNLEQQINIMRAMAKTRREDTILRLRETLKIAEALKIENPPSFEGQTERQLSSIMIGELMYMRGAKALRAEISSLEARESDDSFIGGLRALQERYALYTKLSPDESQVSVYRKDGVVETSDKPIKPKKLIIIVLGAVFGIFLGCLVGLLRIVQFRR
ncbi:O-antigen chain length regulator [Pseudomonas aeruginosa]|uniref:LPS O-antigen chain length determinant protein WzzB n=1 Tax=Pseudomonas aeruginosa TaxID=287 RepID=UPI00071BA5B8|nr:Wzz/FepE/Etk N-terminal domain-containing protein [Pseudomonas aeruginosa]KSM30861.1 O-antigen chain length regulator [Pseudomonas aeruginosa]